MPIGTTHEGRQIPLIKVGRPSEYRKPAIWIDGGIHAREWVSPAVVLYMIDQLVEHYDKDPQMRNFVNNLDWYIVPLLNPDGYEYSRSSTNPEIRLWRKNRSPPVCIETRSSFFAAVQTRCCQGVDLNRNFDWDFGVEGSSTDPCSEIYQGAYAFSEPETRAVRDFISGRHGQVRTFLTFHSYSQILMYPFGHQVRTYTNDVYDLRSTALHAASALRSLYGTTYVVGTGADTLYPASGGSEDWAKGRMGVKYSYLFELRPEEQVWDGFLLAENQIIPTSRETFEAVKVIATHTLETAQSNIRRAPPSRDFTDTCVDRNPNCGYWARNGACSVWPSMREQCARSCGFCPSMRAFRG
uniref:Carboxypeptidase B n=1 Tax=Ascaris suum TaxID=6253 RepID=F1L9K7_ASCSU